MSEIKIGETNAVNNEFIEIYNRTEQTIDISNWKLQKKTSTGSVSSIASIDTCVFLPPKKHFLWANTAGRFSIDADKTTTASLAINNTFELLDQNGIIQDSFVWDSNPHNTESAEKNTDTLVWNFTTSISPTGHEYICQKPPVPTPTITPTESSSTSTSIRINEILPDPTTGQEFIELYNFGDTDIDLKDWSLHDASKTGRYGFKNSTIIKAQSYLTLYHDTLSFALNNTDETVTLFDPYEKQVDTITYATSKEDVSYNFSSSGWRWSDLVTPDAANQFNALPNIKTTVPKHIYKDMPAEFTAKTADEKSDTRYVWDFGDGHTSRLASATHTYAKTGKYTVTLTTSTAIEDIVETYSIKVEKLPKIKMAITAINPNPSGADTGNESITLKNLSKKKVDLLDWSIATGTAKKTLSNHPVRESLIIKPGKVATITNDISAFSLPNKTGFIELRQPDKKVADDVHYTKSDGIKEDELYQKSAGKVWVWILDNTITDNTVDTDTKIIVASDDDQIQADTSQIQNITTANDILSAIDTLSTDELSLLKTQIEERLQIATLTKTQTAPSDNSIADRSDAIAQRTLPPYHTQSLLVTDQQNSQEKILSLINQNVPAQKTLMSSVENTSLLTKDPVIPSETHSNTRLLESLNQTISSLLRRF